MQGVFGIETVKLGNGKTILSGKNLSKEFNGNVVLEDVSITCTEGNAIALVGENGAGHRVKIRPS